MRECALKHLQGSERIFHEPLSIIPKYALFLTTISIVLINPFHFLQNNDYLMLSRSRSDLRDIESVLFYSKPNSIATRWAPSYWQTCDLFDHFQSNWLA